jgi:hypothetical protein
MTTQINKIIDYNDESKNDWDYNIFSNYLFSISESNLCNNKCDTLDIDASMPIEDLVYFFTQTVLNGVTILTQGNNIFNIVSTDMPIISLLKKYFIHIGINLEITELDSDSDLNIDFSLDADNDIGTEIAPYNILYFIDKQNVKNSDINVYHVIAKNIYHEKTNNIHEYKIFFKNNIGTNFIFGFRPFNRIINNDIFLLKAIITVLFILFAILI